MTTKILNGDCLELMKDLPDKSVDLVICDLPYGETNCNWDSKIDLVKFWEEFKRIRKSKRTCCIHFCSTKFGYTLIKSNEKMFKMDMVWKKRNKTGGLQSRHRPLRNHEMVYFFYEQAPKYNRDKYHKRIKSVDPDKKNETIKEKATVVEEKTGGDIYGETKTQQKMRRVGKKVSLGTRYPGGNEFNPPNPSSVLEEHNTKNYETKSNEIHERTKAYMSGNKNLYDPRLPASVVEEPAEDEPVSMFESTKGIGKRFHQTQKPCEILDFFLKYWADPGDTVLDPTMGSGSTGVACKNLGINFIGFEMNEEIFKTAQKRLDMTTN